MSGNAFTNTKPIKRTQIKTVVNELIDIVKYDDNINSLINPFNYKGLGSTRQILEDKYKFVFGKSGDIDLLFLSRNNGRDIKDIVECLKKYFRNYDRVKETKSFFTNIVSLNFYSIDIEQNVQIDLMIAKNNYEFKYMYELKYWNDENILWQNKIKGLHRTELLRSILKYHAYSLGQTGLYEFVWNDKFEFIQELIDFINVKIKKCRTNESKLAWLEFLCYIENFENMEVLKKELCEDKNKLFTRILNFKNNKSNTFLTETLFNKCLIKTYKRIEEVLQYLQLSYTYKTFTLLQFNHTNKLDSKIINDYFKELSNKKPNQLNRKIKRLFK